MKVAIIGFGVEGQDAADYFLKQGANITVFDKRAKEELVSRDWKDKDIKWVMGPDYLARGFGGFDLIVRSPGFYRYHEKLVEAEKRGAEITSSTILFFKQCPTPLIGVTGTKGKGTTARMLELALKGGGFKTLLAGNIGEPMLSLLPKASKADWVVLELSSFQTIDLERSPKIAVVTNIVVDHLGWHKSKEEYVRAKENLWRHQTGEDFVVFNFDDETSRRLSRSALGQVFLYSTESAVESGAFVNRKGSVFLRMDGGIEVGNTQELGVPGKHNWSNALAALIGAALAGAAAQKAWQGIIKYKGAEHRLEKVAEKDGVIYINDSAATTPESAIAAIETFSQPKILILGGSKKGRTFKGLAEAINKGNVKAVLLIGETSEEIVAALEGVGYGGKVKKGFKDMKKIVAAARKLAKSGDVILLSPACASFGIFANYKDRGDKFKEAVLA